MKRLLLLSNSTTCQTGFLGHASETMADFLGAAVREVLFVPYAAVTFSYDDYTSRAREAFTAIGYELVSIHQFSDPVEAVRNAQAIAIGGGNTFHLLSCLYHAQVLQVIRERVCSNLPYIGWSAGANVACPTIQTTNDMPVVWPQSPAALDLVPFQINPHYVDGNPPGFHGETRAQRIKEFTRLNPDVYVVGLPEGGMIRVEGNRAQLLGCKTATVFRNDAEPVAYDSLEFLDQLIR